MATAPQVASILVQSSVTLSSKLTKQQTTLVNFRKGLSIKDFRTKSRKIDPLSPHYSQDVRTGSIPSPLVCADTP